jgi:tetratricopeptide (TPR) repeat protein
MVGKTLWRQRAGFGTFRYLPGIPSMRLFLAMLVIACGLAVTAGCHLTGLGSPVPAALANSRQLSQQGNAALERGQPQEAEQLLAKAVAACPTDRDARRYYAEALWLRGAGAAAVAQLEEACRLDPEDAPQRVRLAEMHLALGQVEAARQSVEMALDRDPRLAAAWAVRGRVMRAEGDFRQALAAYHRALGQACDDPRVLLEIAEVYQQLHEPQRALETLQSLAETYPPGEEPQQVLDLLGQAYAALGRYDDAAGSFASAAARDRPTAELLGRLADAQRRAGRADEAARDNSCLK